MSFSRLANSALNLCMHLPGHKIRINLIHSHNHIPMSAWDPILYLPATISPRVSVKGHLVGSSKALELK